MSDLVECLSLKKVRDRFRLASRFGHRMNPETAHHDLTMFRCIREAFKELHDAMGNE